MFKLLSVFLCAAACAAIGEGAAAPSFPPAPEGARAVFLDAAEASEKTPGEGRIPILSATVAEHDADHVYTTRAGGLGGGGLLAMRQDAWRESFARLRYELAPGAVPAGRYEVWTCFTQGGDNAQAFTISAGGAAPGETRLAFTQAARSWVLEWRKAPEPLYLFGGDRLLEIEIRGRATHQKNIGGFWLVKVDDIPADMTAASLRIRREVLAAYGAQSPEARLVVIEDDSTAAADALYQALLDDSGRRDELAVAIVPSREGTGVAGGFHRSVNSRLVDRRADATAGELRERLALAALPAVVLTTPRQEVRKVWTGPLTAESARALLDELSAVREEGEATASGEAERIATGDTGEPLAGGMPSGWLTLGTWAGPAGLSLWGLDYEARVRPNPGDPEIVTHFDTGILTQWTGRRPADDGRVAIERLDRSYVWSKGSAYAHVYVWSPAARRVVLHFGQTDGEAAGWLNGRALEWRPDESAAAFAFAQEEKSRAGPESDVNDQGGVMAVARTGTVRAQAATLELNAGWNRLLVKLVMRQRKEEVFAFGARFTSADGAGMDGLRTALADPAPGRENRAAAGRFVPRVLTAAPFNLAHAGEPLAMRVDLESEDLLAGTVAPFRPWRGSLELRVTDYDGTEIARQTRPARLPGTVSFDFGAAPARGYYAVHPRLLDEGGNLVRAYPPDGFSVIGGTVAQRGRRAEKKMAVTYYFMGNGDRFQDLYFPYMERLGIFRNIGGHNRPHAVLFREASERGLSVMADMWNERNPERIRKFVTEAAPHADGFKSFNEVDIHPEVRGTPEAWVAKARMEYEIAKAIAPDKPMIGASLVRPGADSWFEECLRLGLADYHDAWDVHCYPQQAPVLEGTMSNGADETELGVLKVYAKLGLKNTKPFWIGETGARSSHGDDGRRWQADMVAKMTACALSRADFEKIGFLIPWAYPRGGRGPGMYGYVFADIGAGHMPAEAAYYTASALVDGFPYTRLELGRGVQAARFGPTTMLWTTEGDPREVRVKPAGKGPFVRVDVVGRASALTVGREGSVRLTLTGSPVYVLPEADYGRLTANGK